MEDLSRERKGNGAKYRKKNGQQERKREREEGGKARE